MGRSPHHTRLAIKFLAQHFSRGSKYFQLGQWTEEARDLYDLLIAIFIDAKDSLADLNNIQKAAGLNKTEWEDLLQYSAQVSLSFSQVSTMIPDDVEGF